MILLFEVGGSNILYGVSSTGGLSVASRASNFVFTPIDDLNKFKRFSGDEKKALEETKDIVSRFKTDDEKKDYIITEMDKLGGFFINELSVEEYLDKFENNGFS